MPDKPKDWWDKADIIGKVFSGIILALIALMIKKGADNISAAQHRGDLVRGLIGDLTTREARTRQDIALIALNHSVGDQNPRLMSEIAERLVLDTTGYSASDRDASQVLGSVAFGILRERDSSRADSVKHVVGSRFTSRVDSDSQLRQALRSNPDTSQKSSSPGQASAVQAVTRLIAPVSSSVIFIQFQGAVERSAMDSLRAALSQKGFVAPGVEHISAPFATSVRYFHSEDSVLADSAARITRQFLLERRLSAGSVTLRYTSAKRFTAPRGQIEVWLHVK